MTAGFIRQQDLDVFRRQAVAGSTQPRVDRAPAIDARLIAARRRRPTGEALVRYGRVASFQAATNGIS
ncbi:hypothetical protein WG70_07995 [Burkholderia oklahomensis EO147]|uniref:hypothetical protein n=1 Tax=Burkholderia oklahomensis TaxID=342113 RepID=UPI00016A8D0B|nr:hypothetical protein [Burkholderia oklahomensis]AOI39577.1 hypothetical protein WG70_07995 [Burkholderia oklahomensis EO147]KUY51508.1 hypothetical protein WG70_16335 [Burkholderia oklahomensis EO147]KUY60696.1 hypothetical protein WI23_13440 [Burkholderia oklahomensis C6786]